MPAKNAIKVYKPNSFYHIYNRGLNKQIIFKKQQDYGVFLGYLKQMLLPVTNKSFSRSICINNKQYQILKPDYQNFSDSIELHSFCLMNNHYHLLIKQVPERGIDKFMKSLIMRYTMYFNKRYKRQGSLFGGRYKAVLITDPEQLLYTSKYIHLNPLPKKPPSNLSQFLIKQSSSYSDHLGITNTAWIHTQELFKCFENSPKTKFNRYKNYKDFVEDLKDQSDILPVFTRVRPW